jgi:hypothetical protein
MNLDSGIMYAYNVRGCCSLVSAALALVHDLCLNKLKLWNIIKYNEWSRFFCKKLLVAPVMTTFLPLMTCKISLKYSQKTASRRNPEIKGSSLLWSCMSREVNPRPLTPEARVYHWDVQCGICGWLTDTKKRFFSDYFKFSLSPSVNPGPNFFHFSHNGRLMVWAINHIVK